MKTITLFEKVQTIWSNYKTLAIEGTFNENAFLIDLTAEISYPEAMKVIRAFNQKYLTL